MSNIEIEDICFIPIDLVMRDLTPKTVRDTNYIILINIHPTDGTHWVLVIEREATGTYNVDSF